MGRKKRKIAKAVEIAPQADEANEVELRPVDDAGKEPEQATPHVASQPELSPLTIALQKERGIYKKRKPHCLPQNQRWSDQYNGPRT